MRLEKLRVSGFRNLAEQEVFFPNRVTIIVGRNAQGKTGLLEAIYLLAHLRSFRASRLSELVAWNGKQAEVSARIIRADGEREVSYSISEDRRSVSVNGKKVVAASQFYGNLKVVEFTPDDLSLVKGAPANRRSFFDRLLTLCDPGYVEDFVHFQRALKSRNRVLQLARGERPDNSQLQKQIRSWTKPLVSYGRRIVEKRLQAVEAYGPKLKETFLQLVDQAAQGEGVNLSYASAYAAQGAVKAEEEIIAAHEEVNEKDLRLKTTSLGPHRDEFTLNISEGSEEHDARQAASQGQARCLALALKLSAVSYLRNCTAEEPIILLDDVESELDQGRKKALADYISAITSQIIMATTALSFLPEAVIQEAQILRIEEGILRPD